MTISVKDVVQKALLYSDWSRLSQQLAEVQAKVVQWKLADGVMLPQEPFASDVAKALVTRWVTNPAKAHWQHGFDDAGKIVYARWPKESDGNLGEWCVIHDPSGEWWICKSYDDRSIARVDWFDMDGAKIRRHVRFDHSACREREYAWQDGRPTSFVEHSWEDVNTRRLANAAAYPFSTSTPYRRVHAYEYDESGALTRLSSILYDKTGEEVTREIHYQKMPPGMTMKSLLVEAEPRLVEAITNAVRSVRPMAEMYCLIVQYTGVDTDTAGFAPPLYLVPESTRRAILNRPNVKNPQEDLWTLGELEAKEGTVGVRINDDKLDELMNWTFKFTWTKSGSYTPVRKLFQTVCEKLNQIDWSGLLNATDDFIVFPAEPHGEFEVKSDIRKCNPDRFKLLKSRGLI